VRLAANGNTTFPFWAPSIWRQNSGGSHRSIRDLLAKDYLVNPQVTLTILEYPKGASLSWGRCKSPALLKSRARSLSMCSKPSPWPGASLVSQHQQNHHHRTRGQKINRRSGRQAITADGDTSRVRFAEDTITIGQRIL